MSLGFVLSTVSLDTVGMIIKIIFHFLIADDFYGVHCKNSEI